jgi:cell division cycle 20-like protein 1, cofactor of APC complex
LVWQTLSTCGKKIKNKTQRNASTAKVTTVCTLGDDRLITSIAWNQDGKNLAVGDSDGKIKIWDVEKVQSTKEYLSHTQRVSSLSWNRNVITSGSRDKTIVTCF